MKTSRLFFFFAIILFVFLLSCHENDRIEDIKDSESQIILPETGLPDTYQIIVGGNSFILPIKIIGSCEAQMEASDWCRITVDENVDNTILKIEIDKNNGKILF